MEFDQIEKNPTPILSQEQEDWTRLQQISYLNIQSLVAIVLMLSSGASLYFSITSALITYNFNLLLLMITCSGLFVLSLLTIFWSLQEPGEMQKSQEIWWDTSDHGLSRFIFIVSSTLLSLLLTSNMGLYVFNDQIRNYFVASGNKQGLDNYETNIMFCQYLGITNFLCTAFIIFTSFSFSNNTNSIRVAFYCQGIVCGLVSGCLIYVAGSTLSLKNLGIIPLITDFDSIQFLIQVSISILVIIFLLKIVNISQSKSGYIAFGTFLMLLTFVLISQNGKIFRNNLKVIQSMNGSCQLTLSGSHEQQMVTQGCIVKYLNPLVNQPSNCPTNQQSLMWEQDSGQAETSQINQISCLNMLCCGASVNIYSRWFNYIVVFGVLLMLNCLILITYSYYLSNKYAGDKQLNRNLEMLYFFLFVIILVLISFGYTKYLQNLKNDDPADMRAFETSEIDMKSFHSIHSKTMEIEHNSLTTQQRSFKVPNYQKWTSYKFNNISPLATCLEASRTFQNNQPPDLDTNQCVSAKCQNQGLRVGIMINGGKFFFDTPFGSTDIRFFNKQAQEIFFPDQKCTDFLAFQGDPTVVKSFISNNLLLCISDPANFSSLMIVGQFDQSALLKGSTLDTFQEISEQNGIDEYNFYHHELNRRYKTQLERGIEFINSISLETKLQEVQKNNKNALKTQIQQKKNHFEDNPDQKWKQAAVNFAALKFEFYNASTGKVIDMKGQNAAIRIYKNQIKCRMYDDLFPIKILQNTDFEAYNLELGTYTFFVDLPGYHKYCKSVILNKKNEIQISQAYLSPKLEIHQMRAVLQWKNVDDKQKINLKMFSSFEMGPTLSCIAGYLNTLCPGLTYQTEADGYGSIIIEKFGSYQYLFFVQEVASVEQRQKKMEDESTGQKFRNSDFFQSHATITVYVGEIQYPPITFDVPAIAGDQEKQIQKEDNIAWIGFCVDGQKGNQAVPGRDFWTSLSKYDNVPQKIETAQFPPALICGQIISKS